MTDSCSSGSETSVNQTQNVMKTILNILLSTALVIGMSAFSKPSDPIERIVIKVNEPVSLSMINPCNGEFVLVEGTIHYRITRTWMNGIYLYKYHLNYSDLKGTGNLGNEYVVAPFILNQTTKSRSSCDVRDRLIHQMTLVGRGDAPDFLIYGSQYIAHNCDGSSVEEFEFETECK